MRDVRWLFALFACVVFSGSIIGASVTKPGRSISGTAIAVEAPAGKLEGRAKDGVEGFVGIPYVVPPTGALRWRAPEPMPRWSGARKADAFGHDCPQVELPGNATPSDQPTSEDCLTLNIWRPAGAVKLPVMVWIHGGGFVMGSAASPVTDGANLARRGVVLVSFNYRLGRFGFFAHPALSAEAHGKPPVNYAFLDMIAALQWVHRSISAFGGDPSRVTIFGQSSGGAAVNFLLASPETRDLFAQAIVQSGANREPYARVTQDRPGRISAENAGLAFAAAAGLRSDADASALRALPADAVQGKLALFDMQADRFTGPVIDGRIVAADPIDRFIAGDVPTVPYLIGSTGAELSLEPFAPLLIAFIEKQLPAAALAELKRAYGDPLDPAVIDDYFFGEAARGYARLMAARGAPTWLYRFDYVAERERAARRAANHTSEVAYVFDNLPAGATPADRAIARALADYWTNFAKASDPNGGDLARWPKARANDPMLLIANAGPAASHDDDPRLDTIERVQAQRPR